MKFEIMTNTIVDMQGDGTIAVISNDTKVRAIDDQFLSTAVEKHVITKSELQYGILTFSRKSDIARLLPLDLNIDVCYKEITYQGHTHASSKGRVDRLTSLLKNNFEIGDEIVATFDSKTKTLSIQ